MATTEQLHARQAVQQVNNHLNTLIEIVNDARRKGVIIQFDLGPNAEGDLIVKRIEGFARVSFDTPVGDKP